MQPTSELNSRIHYETGDDFDRILADLEAASIEKAQAEGQYEWLSHMRKVVAAEQTLAAQKAGAPSVAAAEMQARASEAYKAHLTALHAAKIEQGRKVARYFALRNRFEAARSKLAFARAEIERFGDEEAGAMAQAERQANTHAGPDFAPEQWLLDALHNAMGHVDSGRDLEAVDDKFSAWLRDQGASLEEQAWASNALYTHYAAEVPA